MKALPPFNPSPTVPPPPPNSAGLRLPVPPRPATSPADEMDDEVLKLSLPPRTQPWHEDNSDGLNFEASYPRAFNLSLEKSQLALLFDYQQSIDDSKSLFGTTVLIRKCFTEDYPDLDYLQQKSWDALDIDYLTALDTRTTKGGIVDKLQIVRDNKLKCVLGASGDYLICSSGNVEFSDIIKRDVRYCLYQARRGPKISLEELYDRVHEGILESIELAGYGNGGDIEYGATVTVVDRTDVDKTVNDILAIEVEKRRGHDWRVNGLWHSQEFSMGSGCDALEFELTLDWTINGPEFAIPDLLRLMTTAAEGDPFTGGHCIILQGGKTRPWECVNCSKLPPHLLTNEDDDAAEANEDDDAANEDYDAAAANEDDDAAAANEDDDAAAANED